MVRDMLRAHGDSVGVCNYRYSRLKPVPLKHHLLLKPVLLTPRSAGAGLLANAECQTHRCRLTPCVRQQACSYKNAFASGLAPTKWVDAKNLPESPSAANQQNPRLHVVGIRKLIKQRAALDPVGVVQL